MQCVCVWSFLFTVHRQMWDMSSWLHCLMRICYRPLHITYFIGDRLTSEANECSRDTWSRDDMSEMQHFMPTRLKATCGWACYCEQCHWLHQYVKLWEAHVISSQMQHSTDESELVRLEQNNSIFHASLSQLSDTFTCRSRESLKLTAFTAAEDVTHWVFYIWWRSQSVCCDKIILYRHTCQNSRPGTECTQAMLECDSAHVLMFYKHATHDCSSYSCGWYFGVFNSVEMVKLHNNECKVDNEAGLLADWCESTGAVKPTLYSTWFWLYCETLPGQCIDCFSTKGRAAGPVQHGTADNDSVQVK